MEKNIAVIYGDCASPEIVTQAMRVLDGVEDIAICRLNEADVVRHVIVQRIIKAYEEDEKRKGKR